MQLIVVEVGSLQRICCLKTIKCKIVSKRVGGVYKYVFVTHEVIFTYDVCFH